MLKGKNWKRFIAAKLLLVFMIAGGAAARADAAWGDLDTTFGTNGIVQEPASENYYGADVLVQADGKILVTGYKLNASGKRRFFLRRYLASGAPDTAFGINGSAVINAPLNANYDYSGSQIKMLTASKIVVVGHAGDKIGVWMLNGDGTGYASFGSGGFKTLAYTNYGARLGAINSKPIIAFYYPTSQRVVIIRLNTDGSQDMTFGTDGKSSTNIYGELAPFYSNEFDMFTDDAANTITVGGLAVNAANPPIRLQRKLIDGSADPAFNATGHGTAQLQHSHYTGLYKLNSGKSVYGYIEPDGTMFPSYAVRTSSTGVFEAKATLSPTGKVVGVQPDGKIVIEGAYALGRFDENFTNGDSFSHFPHLHEMQSRRFAFQPDNKMLVLGYQQNSLKLVRLHAN